MLPICSIENIVISFNCKNPVYLDSGDKSSKEFKIIKEQLCLNNIKINKEVDLYDISDNLFSVYIKLKERLFEISSFIDKDESTIPNLEGFKATTNIMMGDFYKVLKDLNISIAVINDEEIPGKVYDLKDNIKTDIDNTNNFYELYNMIKIVTKIIDRLCENCSIYSSGKGYYFMELRCGFLKKYFGCDSEELG